jgi:hypothetical protein
VSRPRTSKADPQPNTLIAPTNGLAQPPRGLEPVEDDTPINLPLGVTGLKRPQWRGQLYEEFLPELSGQRAVRVFREMRDNDSIVGGVMYAVESNIRGIPWSVKGGTEQSAQFLEECIDDLRPNLRQQLTEILSMLTYGWSWHEVLFKARRGPTEDVATTSKFNDGRIGWQSWPIRSQDSLFAWQWDPLGRVSAMLQQGPPTYQMTTLPIQRSLHFTTSIHKHNPEGRSLLRSAYRAWLFRRNIETIEAIGAERDLAGMPIFYRDPRYKDLDNDLKQILRQVKRDEQEGLLIPLVYDDKGNKLIEFALLTSAGARQFDAGTIIERKGREIAMCLAADFLMLGHENVGSFALSKSKTDMFHLALRSVLETIKETINEIAVPRLFRLNGMPLEDLPYLDYGEIKAPDIAEVGAYVQALAASGMPLFPDPDLEDYLRDIGNLPEKSEEAMQMQDDQRQMTADAQAAALAADGSRSHSG